MMSIITDKGSDTRSGFIFSNFLVKKFKVHATATLVNKGITSKLIILPWVKEFIFYEIQVIFDMGIRKCS